MLFDTKATLMSEASLDALWLKTQVISNNLANVDTPGFKASSVSFEDALRQASDQQNREGRDVENEGRSGAGKYSARVTTDTTSSVRLDGNNVSLEKEQNELWKTYAQYSYLLDRVGGHYNTINTVISNMKG